MEEKFCERKAECVVCGNESREIRIENWKLDDSKSRPVIYICCNLCYHDKRAIERRIIELGLDKERLPSGLEPENVKLF